MAAAGKGQKIVTALQHVFLVTYGRSGSTVIQRALQSIPGYFIRGENNHTLFPLYMAYRRAHEARFGHGLKDHSPEDPWYGADKIIPDIFAKSLCDVFVQDVIQPPGDARVVGFKEIRFHEAGEELFESYLDFIARNFPGTRFIFNKRGWEAVSRSSWWATMDPADVRAIIEQADALYDSYAAAHPGNCYSVCYEDYTANPDGLKGLFDFLGEEFQPETIHAILGEHLTHAENVVGGPRESRRNF